jgi:NH3-dependent NAD+ synthetase
MTDIQIESMVTITGAEYVRLMAEIERMREEARTDRGFYGGSLIRLEMENAKLRAALDRLYWYAERLEGVVYGQGNEGEIEVMKEARAALGVDT